MALIFALIFGAGLASAPLEAREVPFAAEQVITTDAGNARSVVPADLDGDGDLDLLSASSYDDKIAWYENTDGAGTFGSQQAITTLADGAFDARAADIDGDGDLDVVSASASDNTIAWYQNTNGAGAFSSELVISTLASSARSVRAADIDGDGDLDVVSASALDDKIAWYENTDGAGTFGSQQVISTHADFALSVFAADVDGDADVDVLSASLMDDKIAWYENTDGMGSFGSQQVISTLATGALSVHAADIDGDGDLDVLSGSSEASADKVAWYENTNGEGSFGSQQVISSLPDRPFSVVAADIDADGDLDVLSASAGDDQVSWYENSASTFGSRQLISSVADGAFAVTAADVDGDGDLDVLSASLYDNEVAWYENETIHRSAVFPEESVISSLSLGAQSVVAADIDGDGDLDILSASFDGDEISWHENVDGDGGFGSPQVVSTLTVKPSSVLAADVDGDGDLDALSGSIGDDKIAWYENTDGQGAFGAQQIISTLANNPTAIVAADVDGDGDLDLLSSSVSDWEIAWYENTDGLGSFGPQQVISSSVFLAQGVSAADIDGDGDLDVLSVGADFGIRWHENSDGQGSFGAHHLISSLVGGGKSILAADVDGDGDLDVLTAAFTDNEIAWYENTDGSGSFGSKQSISNLADNARSVFAADLDSDGDLDVLSASYADDKVAWHENTDGLGGFGPGQVISSSADGAHRAIAADIDGDGDVDVLSASGEDDKIAWYENRGGQFALPTTPLARGILANSQEEVLLQIDFEHRGRAGDTDVELASLELLFEDGSGTALTSLQADGLIDKLELFLDDGSGSFEAGSDSLVEQVTAFSLTGGVETLPLAIGDPDARLAFGSSKRYFVVATLAGDADQQTPSTFEVIHLTEASSSGRDASTSSVPLTLEHEDDTGTGVLGTELTTATCHAPFELDVEGFTVAATVVCEAGTVLMAGDGLEVLSTGDLTLRAGERVVFAADFSVESGGVLRAEIDPALQP